MCNKIGLQIAGSDPGFTIFFSQNWEGEALTHSSERKNSVEHIYYEAVFGSEYWTYVAVCCNFLSNVNREESFKVGLRIPARHEFAGSDGKRVSPAAVLSRIYESVKSTALIRRGADTWRLSAEPVFDGAGYEAILGEYSLRPVWGVAAESRAEGPVVFLELRGADPAVPLLHVPFLSAASEGARVCIGSFTDDIDKYPFTPIDFKAAPFVKVTVEGRDRFYDYVIMPGKQLQLRAADCGYPEDEFESVCLPLDCDRIVSACGIDFAVPSGASCYANAESGVVSVKFFPKPLTTSGEAMPLSGRLIVRTGGDGKTVRSLRIRISSDGRAVREIVCPYQFFTKDGFEMSATIEVAGLTRDDSMLVCLDSPASAECMAFRDDSGAFVADFVRHGRKRTFAERFSDLMGLGDSAEVSGKWRIARWVVIVVLAAMLILGATALIKFAASVIDGVLPFIDKIR